MPVELFTIGYGGRNAESFFGLVQQHKIRNVVDVRLRPNSRLSGFARKDDLPYLLREICGVAYRQEPSLTPTADLLDGLRSGALDRAGYLAGYGNMLRERRAAARLKRADFEAGAALLCTEVDAAECHRSVAASYLAGAWPGLKVLHI
jgi:uncharacterized protein (DUF488 family)